MLHVTVFVATALAFIGAQAAAPFGTIKNLVSFGDSYTDSTYSIITRGTTWGQYAARYANLTLYNFARSGAVCDAKITPRNYDIVKNQLTNYYNLTNTTTLDPKETLYTVWIGTNDVGTDQLITGRSKGDIVDIASCAVSIVSTLYESGARNFLFQNMVPLDKTPLYAADSYPNRYWTAVRNTTEWNIYMKELVAAGNRLSELMIATLGQKLPNITIGYFDSHAFFNDAISHPSTYLNGTAPLNVTGAISSCVYPLGGGTPACETATGTAKDSFLWYDELHPSEQVDRVFAQAIVDVINEAKTTWTRFY